MPAPVVVVPVMLTDVLLVVHPTGTELPVGQLPVAVSLKYQRHVKAPEPIGFETRVIFAGLPVVQNVSSPVVIEPALYGTRTVICLAPLTHKPEVPVADIKHVKVLLAERPEGGS